MAAGQQHPYRQLIPGLPSVTSSAEGLSVKAPVLHVLAGARPTLVSANVCRLQPMIIASAAFYGILPRTLEFVGLTAAASFIYQLQATGTTHMNL